MIRVIHLGLGEIGKGTLRTLLAQSSHIKIAAVVDPAFAGKVLRSLDAGKRRQQLQKKVGAGMSVAEVNALIKKNGIGHVGLGESCAMIAAGLGWKLAAIREHFSPVIAKAPVRSDYYRVQPG